MSDTQAQYSEKAAILSRSVDRARDDIQGNIDLLEQIVAQVCERLDSVITPDQPRAMPDGINAVSPSMSPLANRLFESAARIQNVVDRLRNLCDRLDVG